MAAKPEDGLTRGVTEVEPGRLERVVVDRPAEPELIEEVARDRYAGPPEHRQGEASTDRGNRPHGLAAEQRGDLRENQHPVRRDVEDSRGRGLHCVDQGVDRILLVDQLKSRVEAGDRRNDRKGEQPNQVRVHIGPEYVSETEHGHGDPRSSGPEGLDRRLGLEQVAPRPGPRFGRDRRTLLEVSRVTAGSTVEEAGAPEHEAPDRTVGDRAGGKEVERADHIALVGRRR